MSKTILNFLAAHGMAAAFAWGAFKALIPFPTPSYYLLGGAELARGGAGPEAAFFGVLLRIAFPGAAGGALGAYPYYRWARGGGWPMVERWAPWLGISRARIRNWETKWSKRRRGNRELALAAVSMFSMLAGGLLAGLGEASFGEFAIWAFLDWTARAEILGLTGWRMRTYGDPASLMGTETAVAGAVLAAAAVFWVARSRVRAFRASRK